MKEAEERRGTLVIRLLVNIATALNMERHCEPKEKQSDKVLARAYI